MRADLHTHSNFSDGSAGIGQLVRMAEKTGLDVIAVTDHDTLAHTAEIPAGTAVRVIGGVEISAVDSAAGTRAHILGYNIQKPEIVEALTLPLLKARSANSERQAETLIRLGYRIDMDKLARAGGKYLYKQHIMDYLVTTGQAQDMFGEFYKRVFKNGGVCAFGIAYVSVFDAVRAIKEAGGAAVLAHPGQQKNFYLIPQLVQVGLDGAELNHYSNSSEDMALIRYNAERFGLFLTGGSDCHGRYAPQTYGVGSFVSEESGVKAILGGAQPGYGEIRQSREF